MDEKRVNAAVKIKIQLNYILSTRKCDALRQDLSRLKESMTSEELTEFNKRVA